MSTLSIQKLQTRAASAVVMIPVFIGIVLYGGLPFALLLLAAAATALYEWVQLSRKIPKFTIPLILAGIFYICVSFGAFFLLRQAYFATLALLFVFLIWSSDSGAYFVGKIIGGPKMANKISPNKTWAGMVGAMLCPAVLAMIFSLINAEGLQFLLAFFIGAFIGAVGQGGDLLVSALKRRAEVKDTGDLIPGHGGLLDRIDAMMLTAPVFMLIMIVFPHVF